MSQLYKPGWRDRTQEVKSYQSSLRRLQFLKFALPSLVVVLLAGTFLWPKLQTWLHEKDPYTTTIEEALRADPDLKNKVFNPVFESIDKNGKPVYVRANLATQVDSNKTDFEKPTGKIFMEDGTWVKFWADSGFHKKKEETLDLKGNVRLVTQKGYDLITNSAKILLSKSHGFGKEKIHGTGPAGEHIRADGFKISRKTNTVTFTGQTKMSLPASKIRPRV